MWNQPTTSGTVLYLCLEDNYHRIQDRLLKITDDVPSNIYFAISAKTLAEGLEDQIRDFMSEHRDTIFVAVDVFQMIRGGENENSYACDYRDMLQLKQIATELNIALLVVHHNRKLRDEDPFNMLSGTNTDFVDAFNSHTGYGANVKGLKQMMNKWRYELEANGVNYRSYRSNGLRLLDISFSEVESDVSASNDRNISGGKISVTCDPCVPDGNDRQSA